MITMLANWKGAVEVNGNKYNSIAEVPRTVFVAGKPFDIKLLSNNVHRVENTNTKTVAAVSSVETPKEKRITVKQYMTRPSEGTFDFMTKWNKDIPMPLRTMTGWVEKETRGMVYMHLHGVGEPVIRCMRCGKTLSNPVSRHYGIGPECMSKLGIVADIEDVDTIKKQLVDVTWEGWIIKSAITEEEDV